MSYNTLIFSDNELQGKSLLSYRSLQETQLVTNLELLSQALTQIPTNSLYLFQAHLENPLVLNLKTWAQIYSVIKPTGFVKLQFSSISQENFAKLSNMLKANGFINKDPMCGSLSNELLYSKPDLQSNPVLIKADEKKVVTKEPHNNSGDLKNKEVCGEFSYDKLIEIDPNNKKKVFLTTENKNETLDEDDLLKNEVNYKPFEKKEESCATKPKACKNCSCGRKEKELEEEKNVEIKKDLETGNIKSSCGNCYLGDAFRCAGCPYRGLPAFKPGEKVSLDINNEMKVTEKEDNMNLKVSSDGKVKLF